MICPNCGMETEGKFCPSCGTRLIAPQSAAPAQADEAVKQAETVASAAAAAIAAETVQPAQTPAQGYAPSQSAPNPGYPNQAPAQGYNPSPNQAPNQGYASPNPGYPNQGFPANQAAPNQGYAQNQAAPNQGYAAYPNQGQGYVPAQGFNPPPQSSGVGYRSPTPAEIGQSPASQLVRKLGTSGAFLTGVILTTIAFLINLLVNGRNVGIAARQMSLYSGSEFADTLAGYIAVVIGSLIFSAICVLLLWLIFGAAANKRSPRMGTGALTTFKVFYIIALVLFCIFLALVILGVVLVLAVGDRMDLDEFLAELVAYFNGLLSQYGMQQLPSIHQINGTVFFAVLFGAAAVCIIFGIIFIAKILKTINTAKRVVRTGRPDDRVSTLAAVLIILCAGCSVFSAVGTMVSTGAGSLLTGVAALLGAVASICFAVVIFKFRSGMRRLGVYRGVMTQAKQ